MLSVVIGIIVELLTALNEVGIPVHEEFMLLHFVENLPPGYEFIKNNLQVSKEPLTRAVVEKALRSMCNVQSSGNRGRAISDTALSVSSSKADRGGGGGGGRSGNGKRKPDSRAREEEISKGTCVRTVLSVNASNAGAVGLRS